MTKNVLDYPPRPTYKLYPKYTLEVDDVPLGRLIVELPRMMFDFIDSMESKLMFRVAFVLFVINVISYDGGS